MRLRKSAASVLYALLAGFAAALCTGATAAETENAEAARRQVAGLVGQLGDDSFAERERASKALVELGLVTRPALSEALQNPDAEIRSRAARILAVVLEADFRARLEAFASDVEGKHDHHLPAWQKARAVLGEDGTARALFVEMLRAEPGLLEAYEAGSKPAGEVFTVRCQQLQQLMQFAGGQQQISLGSVAALLLVGSSDAVALEDLNGNQLYSLLHQPAFQTGARAGASSGILKKMLGVLVTKKASANVEFQNLMLACNFELKQGLDLAVRLLKDGGPQHVRQYALLVAARFGTKEQIPAIEPLLKDTTLCMRHRINDREVSIEIRDIALATLVHLSGQQVKDFGFEQAQANPQMVFNPGSLSLKDDAKRTEALKKWTDWSAANLKK